MGRVSTLTEATEVSSVLALESSIYQELHEALVDMCTRWDMRRRGMRGGSEGARAHEAALAKVVGLLLVDSLEDTKENANVGALRAERNRYFAAAKKAAVRLDELDNIQQDWLKGSYIYSDIYATHLMRCRLDVQQLLHSFGHTLP